MGKVQEWQRIRPALADLGWSLARLGEELGLELGRSAFHPSYLSLVSRGLRKPDVAVADGLEAVFLRQGVALCSNRLLRAEYVRRASRVSYHV